jgi:hypothetical protein
MTSPAGFDQPEAEAERRQTGFGGGNNHRYTRRLSDKILIAFHQACDQSDFEVAERLLAVLETMLKRSPPVANQRHRDVSTLVAAHERLWQLRHPGEDALQ